MGKNIFFVFLLFFSSFTFAFDRPKILQPNEAFKVEAKLERNSIKSEILLGDKIYLYDNKLHYKIAFENKSLDITKELKLPKPQNFHNSLVHRKDIVVNIPFDLIKSKFPNANSIKLIVEYQGCSEEGLCYAPLKKEFSFDISKFSKEEKKFVSEQDKITGILKGGNWWLILSSFFGFGLLLSLTPCIFPMIPILSSIIVSQSKEKMSAKKGFFLSLVYVLSMSLAYTIAGILAALFGSNLQSAMQNPVVVIVFSLIFVALALSMFGFYEISLPASWQSKLNKTSKNAEKHGIFGIAVMGFLSALIVGPCVAPPLAGALIYIGQSGNVLLGASALFVMSLGMGVPLLLIGIGAGKYMPKPGVWMTRVSYVFGVVMLGVAIWMLDKIIPSNVTLLLWGLLFLGSAVYMGAFERLEEGAIGWRKFIKTISIFLAIYAVLLIVGAFSKATNPFYPLENLVKENRVYSKEILNKKENVVQNEMFKKISSLKELERVVERSKKPVLIDFSAKWCTACKEFDEITFRDPKVLEVLKDFDLYRIDVTQNSDEDKKLLKKFGFFGPPGIVFYKNGKELKDLRIVGFKEPKEFLKYLYKVKESEERW